MSLYYKLICFECRATTIRVSRAETRLTVYCAPYIVQFILESGSALFGDFMCDFMWFNIYFDDQECVGSIESFYYIVFISFGFREYRKVMIRKTYIGGQIAHVGSEYAKNAKFDCKYLKSICIQS